MDNEIIPIAETQGAEGLREDNSLSRANTEGNEGQQKATGEVAVEGGALLGTEGSVRGVAVNDEAIVGVEKIVPKKKTKEEKTPLERFGQKLIDAHDQIVEALGRCETMTSIANRLQVSRWKLSEYIHATEDLEVAFQDAKEREMDMMEDVVKFIATADAVQEMPAEGGDVPFAKFDGRILAQNLNAAKFWLERQGKKRGWHAKLETDEVGNGGGGVSPIIVIGQMEEAEILEAEAVVEEANRAAGVKELA